jgi:hypothetical protein
MLADASLTPEASVKLIRKTIESRWPASQS